VTELIFPSDYPLSPPKMRFISEMFHPNGTVQYFKITVEFPRFELLKHCCQNLLLRDHTARTVSIPYRNASFLVRKSYTLAALLKDNRSMGLHPACTLVRSSAPCVHSGAPCVLCGSYPVL
jgi:hypothetical protein